MPHSIHPRATHPHGRRARLVAGLALAGLLAAAPALAQGRHPIAIAAGPLDAALLALAAQTHEQLLYPPEIAAGRRAPALRGDYTAEEALSRLLAATDIAVTRAGPAVLVLRSASTTSPAASVPAHMQPASEVQAPARPFGADAGPVATAPAELPVAPGRPPTARPGATGAAATVSEVEVTGTHLRGAGAGASPLLVLSQADLLRSGQPTVAEALKALPQNFGGGAAEGNTTTGADKVPRNQNYATAINLRGLGNNATLVLVNGRRIAGSGAFGDFNDVSLIPTAAVERVEVLLDGASAIYGSDAVGGVVNIILRKDLQGAETRLEAGTGTAGDPTEAQVSQTLGKRWSGGGVLFAYEYQQRSSLPTSARDFAATADLRAAGGTDQRLTTAFPGNILITGPTGVSAPAFAIPAGQAGVGLTAGQLQAGVVNRQNQRLGADLLPRQTLQAVYAAADQDVGERLQVSADARYSLRRYRVALADSISNLTVGPANPFFVSPVGATSDRIAYSFAGDLPNPVQTGTVETIGVTLGGELKLFGDWRTEAYATYGRDREASDAEGMLNTAFLAEALGASADNPATAYSARRDGFFNPFTGIAGSNPAAVTRFIGSGVSTNRIEDQVTSVSLQADGTVWRLPGGAVKLAVGVQGRRETLDVTGTSFISSVTPVPTSETHDARDVTAAFVELRVPLVGPDNARPGLQRLELSLAGRVEHYQALGSTSNPKLGVLWEPADGVRLRGTYGTSFRAPALVEMFDSPGYAPLLLTQGAGKVESLLLVGGNADLRPETATTWTAGFDLRPAAWPGLTLGATWFDIKYRNRIDKPVQQNLTGALSDPNLAGHQRRGPDADHRPAGQSRRPERGGGAGAAGLWGDRRRPFRQHHDPGPARPRSERRLPLPGGRRPGRPRRKRHLHPQLRPAGDADLAGPEQGGGGDLPGALPRPAHRRLDP
jgi:iron complex outermembrane receptor protein